MAKYIVTQSPQTKQVESILSDGVHFDPAINEWVVVVEGEEVAWTETQEQAWRSYSEIVDCATTTSSLEVAYV